MFAVAGIVVLIGIWAAISAIMQANALPTARFLPAPIDVAVAGYSLMNEPRFWNAFVVSNARVLASFLLAVTVGVVLGFATAWRFSLFAFLQPILVLFRYMPIAAIVPISIIILGISTTQKVMVLFFGTVFYITMMTQDAIQRFPVAYIDTARTLGLSKVRILRTVIFPGVAPDLFDAARIGMALTWSYLLVAEIVAADNGLGLLLMRAQRFLEIGEMYFFALLLAIIGLLYDAAFAVSKRRIFPWL